MSSDSTLAELARRAGLHASFLDMKGIERPITPPTQRALLAANGLPAGTVAEVRDSLAQLDAETAARLVPDDVIVAANRPATLDLPGDVTWQVLSETGDTVIDEGRASDRVALPPLRVGVYLLHVETAQRTQTATLLVTPDRAPAVEQIAGAERQWGVVAALYALRSPRNSGIGDFRDLGDLAFALGTQGAGFLGINPVHALGWGAAGTISPYSPTHRGFLNTAHIALDSLPQAPSVAPVPEGGAGLLDYAGFFDRHRQGLQDAFAAFEERASGSGRLAFEAFVTRGGAPLREFALFEALSAAHGPDARRWPVDLADKAVAERAAPENLLRFHLWLQWVTDTQLTGAQARAREGGMQLGLYLDLAVGARLGGAEYWANGAARATGVSIGAPPDDLSPAGQNWGLCAYAPRKLTATRYAALRQILRQSMRHCGILRIDHALGLNRSFWLPADGTPGGYIAQPFEALLAVVAIEAWQAGTVVVGEDLGLVPPGFRARIARAGFYGYTVLQFERDGDGHFRRPADLRPQTLACFGTHDTATLRGYWEGHDIDWWRKLDWISAEDENDARARRTAEKVDLLGQAPETGVDDVPFATVQQRVHSGLAAAPTALSAVQLDDLFGTREAQNLPGTVDQHPNWRRAYPQTVAELTRMPVLRETAEIMWAAGRGGEKKQQERTGNDE